jgi:hypothetical protein
MSNNYSYSVPSYEELVESRPTVSVKVKGFWSDVIRLYIRPVGFGDEKWSCEISVSSGGRDTKEVESDVEAYSYFADAVKEITEVAAAIDLDKLGKMHAEFRAKKEAEYAAARDAEQAAIDADVEVGAKQAAAAVNAVKEAVQKGGSAAMTIYSRGSNPRKTPIAIEKTDRGVCFKIGGRVVGRARVIEIVAASSKEKLDIQLFLSSIL